jgi:hypothetical protein
MECNAAVTVTGERREPMLSLQVEALVGVIDGLPNWLRGFDSRRPLPI